MMTLRNGALAFLFALILFVPTGNAQAVGDPAGNTYTTTGMDAMLKQIQSLMTMIQDLQKQLNVVQGEVRSLLKDGLREGMTDTDIAKLQELLATDSAIYPEGKKTGYFGPLTLEAVKRFQARHGLAITGIVDGETRDLLEEYLHEGFGDKIPPGLLRAPGIMKKVEMRYALGCEKKGLGMGPLCKKYHGDNHDDDDEDEDKHFYIDIEIEDDETTLTFKLDGVLHEVTVDGTDEDDVLDEVADELNKDVSFLDDHLVEDIIDALEDAIDEAEEDAEDFNIEIEIEGGTTTVSFEFDGDDYDFEIDSTDEDDILDEVADELDEDVDDLDNDLVDAIEEALNDALDESEDAEAEDDADDALDDAQDAIEEAQDAIDDAADDVDTNEAEDLLDDAENALEDAELAFDDEDYEDAEDLADEAKQLAEDAIDAL